MPCTCANPQPMLVISNRVNVPLSMQTTHCRKPTRALPGQRDRIQLTCMDARRVQRRSEYALLLVGGSSASFSRRSVHAAVAGALGGSPRTEEG